MEAHIGIKTETLKESIKALNQLLADEHLIYIKTRNAHWNVESPDFYYMHKLFEDQYKLLEEAIDEVAERIRTVGHYALGTLKEFLSLTHLSEERRGDNSGKGYVKDLLEDHESIVINLRKHVSILDELNDQGTTDFITGIIQLHEKMAWMLRSHLK